MGETGPPKGLCPALGDGLHAAVVGMQMCAAQSLLAVTEQPPLTGSGGWWFLAAGTKPSLQLAVAGDLPARLMRESRSQRAQGDKWNSVGWRFSVPLPGCSSRAGCEPHHCQSVLTTESHSNKPQQKYCWHPRLCKGPVQTAALPLCGYRLPSTLLTPFLTSDSGSGLIIKVPSLSWSPQHTLSRNLEQCYYLGYFRTQCSPQGAFVSLKSIIFKQCD